MDIRKNFHREKNSFFSIEERRLIGSCTFEIRHQLSNDCLSHREHKKVLCLWGSVKTRQNGSSSVNGIIDHKLMSFLLNKLGHGYRGAPHIKVYLTWKRSKNSVGFFPCVREFLSNLFLPCPESVLEYKLDFFLFL